METASAKKTILIIDDDESIRDFLRFLFETRNFAVLCAQNAAQALIEVRKRPSLILLDLMMPEIDGWQLAGLIKSHGETASTPLIFISASKSVEDEVRGLELGAVDFITKPFSIPRLMARVNNALLRFAPVPGTPETIIVNDLTLDPENYTVIADGHIIQFPKKEFEVLLYLVRNSNRIVSRDDLLENVWDYHFDPQTNVIDVHISRLRGKIDKGFEPPLLQTVRGAGYSLREGII